MAARAHKTDGSWCWCREEEAAYRYKDSAGRVVGRKRRITQDAEAHGRGKTFVWAKGSKQPDLYRLPEVIREAGLGEDGCLWHLTSEKDVGFAADVLPGTAFSLPNGEKPLSRESAEKYFSGYCGEYHIVLDDDPAGWAAAAGTYAALSEVEGVEVFVWRSRSGKDLFRHLTAGYGLADLIAIPPVDLPPVTDAGRSGERRRAATEAELELVRDRLRDIGATELREGGRIYFTCPNPDHPDEHPSFNAELVDGRVLFACSCRPVGSGGRAWFGAVLEALSLVEADLYPASPGASGYARNDTGNAQRLIDAHIEDMYWVNTGAGGAGEWRIWNGICWRVDIDGVVERWAHGVVKGMQAEAQKLVAKTDPKSAAGKAARDYLKYAILCGNDARIRAMLNRAKTLDPGRTVLLSKFDSNPKLVGLKNGVLELLRDGVEFREEKHTDYLTLNAGTPYLPGARSKAWSTYLDLFLPDEDVREFVLRVLGYSMLGGNPAGLIVFLQGGSNTGKSTINNMLSATFRGYTSAMNMSALRGSWGSGPREDIADIIRSRFALASESDGEIELHADQIKRFTGDDEISFARKFGHQESMRPWFTPIVATNAPPVIKGADLALHNRLCVLPFDHSVVEKDESGRNMCEDEAARIAFLGDVVDGYRRYCSVGLSRETWPNAVLLAVQEYKEQLSEVSQFVAEMCEFGPEEREEAGSLLRAYMAWSDAEKSERQLQTWFGRELARLGHGKIFARGPEGTKPVWHRIGLRLRSNAVR